MRYIITIDLENAAFYNGDGEHDPTYEVARILWRLRQESYSGTLTTGPIMDINGNTVGRATLTEHPHPSSVTVSGPDMVTGIKNGG